MNGPQLRALVADAIYQVLDNWVFRILACLTILPILLTFLIGFRDDKISLSQHCIGTDTFQFAADDHSRIQASLGQYRGYDRRRGGLAVRAGNGDAVF